MSKILICDNCGCSEKEKRILHSSEGLKMKIPGLNDIDLCVELNLNLRDARDVEIDEQAEEAVNMLNNLNNCLDPYKDEQIAIELNNFLQQHKDLSINLSDNLIHYVYKTPNATICEDCFRNFIRYLFTYGSFDDYIKIEDKNVIKNKKVNEILFEEFYQKREKKKQSKKPNTKN